MNAKALGLYYTFIIHRTIYVSVLYVIVFCFSFFLCLCFGKISTHDGGRCLVRNLPSC